MRKTRSLGVAALAVMLAAFPVYANHVEPEEVALSYSCGTLDPGTVEFQVDAAGITDGAVGEDDFTLSVDISGEGDRMLSFAGATLPIRSAVVAGTTTANLYVYDEPVTEDDGLRAPTGELITRFSVCYVGGEPTEETPGAESPAAATPAAESPAAESPAGGVAGAEGTPPSTSTVGTSTGTGNAVSAFALVVLGCVALSAGVVRLATVRAPVRNRRRRG